MRKYNIYYRPDIAYLSERINGYFIATNLFHEKLATHIRICKELGYTKEDAKEKAKEILEGLNGNSVLFFFFVSEFIENEQVIKQHGTKIYSKILVAEIKKTSVLFSEKREIELNRFINEIYGISDYPRYR